MNHSHLLHHPEQDVLLDLGAAALQTGTARLPPRMLAGHRRGPVFRTDRTARPSVALIDIDPTTGKARLSYRRAAFPGYRDDGHLRQGHAGPTATITAA